MDRHTTLCQRVNHRRDLIIFEAVYLKCLCRADSGTDAAACAFNLIVTYPAVLINKGGVKRADSETGQARHAFITLVLGNNAGDCELILR